jgi:hypothetical protein
MSAKQRESIVEIVIGVDGHNRRAHDPIGPGIGRHAHGQASSFDDTVVVDDHQGADAGLFHDRCGVMERALRPDADARTSSCFS